MSHNRSTATVAKPDVAAMNSRMREQLERYSLAIAWMVMIGVFSILKPDIYPTMSNFSSILGSNAVIAVLTLGLIIVLRAGDYDLSIAATMTICGVFLGVITTKGGMSVPLAVLLTIALGAFIGLVNSFIILVLDVDPFITTLGMATLLQGLALWISGSRSIVGLPNSLIGWVVVRRIFGIPLEFYYALILMAVIWYCFRYTSAGRRLLYVGKNREVARLSGLPVSFVRGSAFVAAGAVAGIAGTLYAGTAGSADPGAGLNYLLPVYAAAFLGATAIEVGEFNPIGTVLAVYFLVSGVAGLAILGVPSFVQQIFYGCALIVAVAVSQTAARAKRRAAEVAAAAREGK